jgi:hypothetical protein
MKNLKILAVHLVLPSIFLFPTFTGKIIIPGTDLLFNHFPNFIFGIQQFKEFSEVPLWNPYIFNGFDMTQSIHAHYLNIYLSPLLLLSPTLYVHASGFLLILLSGLIGYFWNKLAIINGVNSYLSLFIGFIAQLGMFFWIMTTTFIGVFMFLGATLSIFNIYTLKESNKYIKFIFLTLSLSLILSFPHFLYIGGFLAPIIFLLFYLFWLGRITLIQLFIGFSALFTGIVINLYRLVPVYEGIFQGTYSKVFDLASRNNQTYSLLTFFNPTALGGNLHQSSQISNAINNIGMHIQNSSNHYIGIFILILIIINYKRIFLKEIKPLILIIFLLIAIENFLFQPFTDLFVYIFPQIQTHMGFFKPFISIIILVFLIELFKNLNLNKLVLLTNHNIYFILLSMFTIIFVQILSMIKSLQNDNFAIKFLPNINDHSTLIRIVFIIFFVFFLIFIKYIYINKFDFFQSKYLLDVLIIFFMFLGSIFIVFFRFNNISLMNNQIIAYNFTFLSLIIFYLVYRFNFLSSNSLNFGVLILGLFIFLILNLFLSNNFYGATFETIYLFCSIFGLLVFLISVLIFILIIKNYHITPHKQSLFLIIFAFQNLFFLMSIMIYINSYLISPYFQSYSQLYPNEFKINNQLDLKSFRFNNVTNLLMNRDGELLSNANAINRIPSYSGIDSYVNEKLVNFINIVDPANDYVFRGGLTSSSKNNLILDMFSVNYISDGKGQVISRNRAIPRLAAFKNCSALSDSENLKLISSNTNLYLSNLFFTDNSGALLNCKLENSAKISFNKITLVQDNPSSVRTWISESENRNILFNETYDESWKFLWNGRELKKFPANYLFMGVQLPKGSGNLSIIFYPNDFFNLRFLALGINLILFISVLTNFILRSFKKAQINYQNQSS